MILQDTSNLGKNLQDLIHSNYKESKFIVIRDEWDKIMDLISKRKIENKYNFIWWQHSLDLLTIEGLNKAGYIVWNPKRGINYGKTWPGYRISWDRDIKLKYHD